MSALEDRDADAVAYDRMWDLAITIDARYIAWANAATATEVERHWLGESDRLGREVRSVDPRNRGAIELKQAELSLVLTRLPEQAPEIYF